MLGDYTPAQAIGPRPICVCDACASYVYPTEHPTDIPRGPRYRLGECPGCGNVYAVT